MNIPENFIEYVLDFYGKGGLYDIGATKAMVIAATIKRLEKYPDTPFEGDSLDREWVRDIIWDNEWVRDVIWDSE